MDERQRAKVKTMLEFYQDLGIEEFYIRRTEIAKAAPRPQRLTPDSADVQTLSTEKRSESRLQPIHASLGSPPVSQHQLGGSPQAAAAPGPAARPMSLFESASTTAPREHETLEEIHADLGECRRCRLASGRHTIVFGQGNPHAELIFVGEGPGADEDAQGIPFVGRAGRLLNRMIELAGMKREDVYICNVVKCRPPNNRTPLPDEIETCSPFLLRQIQAIKPRLVCCLGAPAVKTLLGAKEGITKIRGQFYDFQGTKALPTFHPAYVLRNPREEKILREDFQKIVDFLGSPR